MKTTILSGLTRYLIYGFLFSVTCSMFFPFVWMTYSSLKKNSQEVLVHPWSLPSEWKIENYQKAVEQGRLFRYMGNSLWITFGTVTTVLLAGSAAAYAFARQTFPGKEAIFFLFLLGLILPVEAFLIPLFLELRWLDLINSRFALILVYSAVNLPLAIYILHAFMLNLPKDLEESAVLDGCGMWGVYWHIVLPLSKPALSAVGIFTALSAWNEFMLALILLRRDAIKTLPLGMLAFQGFHNLDYPLLLSGLTLASLPMIGIYILFQKPIVAGLTAGALKE